MPRKTNKKKITNSSTKTHRVVTTEKCQLRPLRRWAESALLGWDRVKVSKCLDATAPGFTSLTQDFVSFPCKSFEQFERQNLVRKVDFNLIQVLQYKAKGCLVTYWLTFQKKKCYKTQSRIHLFSSSRAF